MKKIPVFAHCLRFEELFTFKPKLVAMKERERERETERDSERQRERKRETILEFGLAVAAGVAKA